MMCLLTSVRAWLLKYGLRWSSVMPLYIAMYLIILGLDDELLDDIW